MQIVAFFNKFNDFIFVVLFSQLQNPQSCALCSDTNIIERMFCIVNPQLWAEHAKPHPCQNLKRPFGQVHSITAICMISTFFGRKFRQKMSLFLRDIRVFFLCYFLPLYKVKKFFVCDSVCIVKSF